MTDEQFERLRRNRRPLAAASLAALSVREERRGEAALRPSCTPVARVVAQAARVLQRRQVAEQEWRRVVDGAWQADTAVVSLAEGVLTVAVRSSAVLYALRRRGVELERQLTRAIPGVSRVTFVVSELPDPPGHPASGS